MKDFLHKYLSADRSTRVQALRLQTSWQTGLAHQQLPAAVAALLGELTAASALLAASLKFDGSVVLQLQGNGAVRLILVECNTKMQVRATAQVAPGAQIDPSASLQQLLNADAQGRFMVLLDPSAAKTQAYQGIVPLEGDSVAEVLQHYMRQSEQLDTRMWLAADSQGCAGFMLQRMPAASDSGFEPTWEHYTSLAATIGGAELLATEPTELIRRLFWQDELLQFPAVEVSWHCPCSRERVSNMLKSLGSKEVQEILTEQNQVSIDCNFCGKNYLFDAADCAALFMTNNPGIVPGTNTRH